jgi:DNA-binding transcriptional MerR regulator
LQRLRDIGSLLDAGLNLAGIEMVLALRIANSQLKAEVDRLNRRDQPESVEQRDSEPPIS